MALKIDIRPGESIMIGSAIVKLVKKSGQLASLVIYADSDVQIEGPYNGEGVRPGSPRNNNLSFVKNRC